MKKSTVSLTLSNMLFILLLALSGTLSGALSEAVYIVAFLLPAALLIYLSRGGKSRLSLRISAKGALTALTATPATVGGIFLISYLSALLMAVFGFSSSVDLSGDILTVILTSALLPAVLEELLFRYAALSALDGMKNAEKVLITAFFFALSHCNLFSIPYAFFAGVIFAALDILTGSILPSLFLHFINNLISIFWTLYISNSSPTLFLIVLTSLSLISILTLTVMRRYFFGEKRLEKIKLKAPSADIAVFAALTVAIAIMALI